VRAGEALGWVVVFVGDDMRWGMLALLGLLLGDAKRFVRVRWLKRRNGKREAVKRAWRRSEMSRELSLSEAFRFEIPAKEAI